MKGGRWALFGAVLGAVAALVCFAPAIWAAKALDRWSDGRVELFNVRGTVWSGSAWLGVAGGRGSGDRAMLPTPISWTLRPAGGGLSLHLASSCCIRDALHAQLTFSAREWELALGNLSSDWPAELLQGLGAPWNTVGMAGNLRVQGEGLTVRFNSRGVSVWGAATIDATEMSSSLVPIRPVGSYRLELQGGDVARLRLATMGGPLTLVGEGTLAQGRLGFSGVAQAEGPDALAFESLLGIVGRRVGRRSEFRLG